MNPQPPLPGALREAIAVAWEAVQRDPDHHLALQFRWSVYMALDASTPEPEGDGATDDPNGPFMPMRTPGYLRRAHLDLATARRVLPYWERVWPDERLPHDFLADAEAILAQTKRRSDFVDGWLWYAYVDVCAWGTEDEDGHYPDAGAFYACAAALAALRRVAHDHPHHVELLKYVKTDKDLDFDQDDAAFDGAGAEAGGHTWDPIGGGDPIKRLGFWRWWLHEAVPAAWASVPEA